MPNDDKIDVRVGGNVNGTSFKWKNGHGNKTTAYNFTPNYLTASSYPVPGSSNGKDGEMDAGIVTNASGDCSYSWSDEITATTGSGTLHVNNTGKP
jgi:hypothetical protein